MNILEHVEAHKKANKNALIAQKHNKDEIVNLMKEVTFAYPLITIVCDEGIRKIDNINVFYNCEELVVAVECEGGMIRYGKVPTSMNGIISILGQKIAEFV